MSGQLGGIPYPLFLGSTNTQPVPAGNTWLDTPQPGQSPGWFMPEAGGNATMSPATGRPYIDMSLPPYVAPAPATPAVAPSVPVVTGQPPTVPPTAVVMPTQPPDHPPVLPMGPDGKPQSTREYTVHPDGSITKNVLPPTAPQQWAQQRQQQYQQMTAQTGLTPQQQLQKQQGQPQQQTLAEKLTPKQISPLTPYEPALPMHLTMVQPPEATTFKPPAWAPSAAVAAQPPHPGPQMVSGYSADDHERTAQRYRAMLA